ncbi:hypothetical protein BC835DRAFT_26080 [Cytidiella melzeri]|nr:hypothetical protein BC835DRAFT_26080 [Cytidiella melzeri]
MAGTNAGVLAWCDNIRFTMARDPGRELFAAQIQQHGFDFLQNYIGDVFARQPTDSLYELMKTPGKKKDVPKRTRTATATAMSLKAVNSTIFEEQGDDKENSVALNDFHKALMDARDDKEVGMLQDRVEPLPAVKEHIPKTVAIADSPESQAMNVDQVRTTGVDVETLQAGPALVMEKNTDANTSSAEEAVRGHESPAQLFSSPLRVPSPVLEEPLLPEQQSEYLVTDSVPEEPAQSDPNKELSMIAEDDEPNEQSLVPDKPSPPVPVDYDMDQDITVPLRESSSSGTLKRKQSVTQFSGLPAPSPLRKSMRMSRAPSLAQTPGVGLGGKRTSWLVKAKEAKALEMTGSGKRGGMSSEASTPDLHDLRLGLSSTLPKPEFRPSSRGIFEAAPVVPHDAAAPAGDNNDIDLKVNQHEEPPMQSGKKRVSASLDEDFTGRLNITRVNQKFSTWTSRTSQPDIQPARNNVPEDLTVPIIDEDTESGALDRLKRTLEGAGSRPFRSLGKSLGGNAAAALAEARAAAEARVAQRNLDSGADVSVVQVESTVVEVTKMTGVELLPTADKPTKEVPGAPVTVSSESDKRLSLSELVSTISTKKCTPVAPANDGQASPGSQDVDMSVSTTPPNSPPPMKAQKPAILVPVFKPVVPVPAAPGAKSSGEPIDLPSTSSLHNFSFKLPSTNPFSIPVPDSLNVHTAAIPASSSSKPLTSFSVVSSKASMFSDTTFDHQVGARGWMPTQDPDSSANLAQTQEDVLEDEDSWHMDEQFRANETWTPYGFVNNKDDSTWSTLPSQHEDTGPMLPARSFADALQQAAEEPNENYTIHAEDDDNAPGAFDDFAPNVNGAQLDINDDELDVDVDLNDIIAADNAGFFGQASRFMSSMLSNGKAKTKNEPVKSVIRAAAIAKKQQGEADKKATRLREMENRRQLAMQRKAEEEKVRAEEEEKRIREENDKRKREREEHTGKLPLSKLAKRVCKQVWRVECLAHILSRRMTIRWVNESWPRSKRSRSQRSRRRKMLSLRVP